MKKKKRKFTGTVRKKNLLDFGLFLTHGTTSIFENIYTAGKRVQIKLFFFLTSNLYKQKRISLTVGVGTSAESCFCYETHTRDARSLRKFSLIPVESGNSFLAQIKAQTAPQW